MSETIIGKLLNLLEAQLAHRENFMALNLGGSEHAPHTRCGQLQASERAAIASDRAALVEIRQALAHGRE